MSNTNRSKSAATFSGFECHDDTIFPQVFSLRNSRFPTTDEGVVTLGVIGRLFPSSSNDPRTDLLQPNTSGFVAHQAKNPLHSSCSSACSMAVSSLQSGKPHRQKLVCAFTSPSSCQRGLMMVARVFKQVSILDPPMNVPAIRTSESVWPSQSRQRRPAPFLCEQSVLNSTSVSGKSGGS
jgi:hypothetical protein